jgi:hypothetical protein
LRIAWAGWSLEALPEWRPLRIAGSWSRGEMMIGTSAQALLQVKWWRPQALSMSKWPRQKRFDAAAWIAARVKKDGRRLAVNAPSPARFAHIAWLPGQSGKASAWYGFAEHAGLVIEIVTNGSTDEALLHHIFEATLPSLAAAASDEPTAWSVFGASFEAPVGFVIAQHRINLGDIALSFTNTARDTLMLRQMYPAKLTLAHRPLERWIGESPFPTRLRNRADSETAAIERGGRTLLRRQGTRSLRFPLAFIRPAKTVNAACHDAERDRLLICSYASRKPADGLVEGAIAGMNRRLIQAGAR